MKEQTVEVMAGSNRRNETSEGGLYGKKVVVTRAPHQAEELAELLREKGSEPVLYPCIEISPPGDTSELDADLQRAAEGVYDWLIITSTNTAWILGQRANALNLKLNRVRAVAIGPRTAAAARKEMDLEAAVVSKRYTAEDLVDALPPVNGCDILLPQSDIARPILEEELRQAGARVKKVTAYSTGLGEGGADLVRILGEGSVHAVTFTSSSTARNFLCRLGNEGGSQELLHNVCLAAIGPVTARTMEELGLHVSVQPAEFTLSNLVEGLEDYFLEKRDAK